MSKQPPHQIQTSFWITFLKIYDEEDGVCLFFNVENVFDFCYIYSPFLLFMVAMFHKVTMNIDLANAEPLLLRDYIGLGVCEPLSQLINNN